MWRRHKQTNHTPRAQIHCSLSQALLAYSSFPTVHIAI